MQLLHATEQVIAETEADYVPLANLNMHSGIQL